MYHHYSNAKYSYMHEDTVMVAEGTIIFGFSEFFCTYNLSHNVNTFFHWLWSICCYIYLKISFHGLHFFFFCICGILFLWSSDVPTKRTLKEYFCIKIVFNFMYTHTLSVFLTHIHTQPHTLMLHSGTL